MQAELMQKMEKNLDETYIRYLAKKYTTQYADMQDLLQELRIKAWLLKDRPGKNKILLLTAREWYKKKKKEPVVVSLYDFKDTIDAGGDLWI